MTTREEVLVFLEMRRNVGYTVYELMEELKTSESRTRKHLRDLVNESIITQYENFYGFMECPCDIISDCDEYASSVCDVWSHRCGKRDELWNNI